jgi:hypothetical protein
MASVPLHQDRILVLQAAHHLSIWKSDGSEHVEIKNDQPTLARLQPTWSWDGRYLASVSVIVSDFDAKYRIEILDVSSGLTRSYPVDRTPFFFAWHPDCTRLIYLSAGRSLVAAYLDIFETPSLIPSNQGQNATEPNESSPKDQTVAIYTGDAFYTCFSPIPGAERVIANVPGARTAILGFHSSMASIPLSFTASRVDRNLPELGKLIATPSNFEPPSLNPDPENVLSTAALCYSQTPWWNSCNTMVVGLHLGHDDEQIIAFDGLWNPKLEGETLLDLWRREGSEGVQRLMQRHPMESHVEGGVFQLRPPGPIFSIFKSKGRLSFVCSPNGRYAACYDHNHLVIVEFLYDPPWTPHHNPTERYFDRFHPRRLVGTKTIYETDLLIIAAAFSPDNQSILALTRVEAQFRWNTLKFVAGQNAQLVPYRPFMQSAFLMRHYIPFFTQYTQSMQLYSPDGARFCYPADGNIYLQDVVESGEAPAPKILCAGTFCAWSWR